MKITSVAMSETYATPIESGLTPLRQQAVTPRPISSWKFSPLRSLGFFSLFLGVRGQLRPAEIELSSLNGTDGFVLNGASASDQSGYSVSCAGDVNGDGVSDLLIGAPGADLATGRVNAGKSYVVFGKPGLGSGGTLELSNLNGISGFILNGASAGDWSGWSVSSAGDVNGDGVADLLIGADKADPATGRKDAGKSYVVFGRRLDTTARSIPTTIASLTLLQSTSAVTSPPPASTSESVPITTAFPPTTLRSSKTPMAAYVSSRLDSSEPPSLGLPLGIAGGVCAVISSIGAAVFALWRRRQTLLPDPEQQNPPSEYAAIDSLVLPTSNYDQLKLHPKGHTHYVGDKELQVFNREREQYESAKAANVSGYANLPQNQPTPQGYSVLGQLNREHDEYESARLARAPANYDDISR